MNNRVFIVCAQYQSPDFYGEWVDIVPEVYSTYEKAKAAEELMLRICRGEFYRNVKLWVSVEVQE